MKERYICFDILEEPKESVGPFPTKEAAEAWIADNVLEGKQANWRVAELISYD